MFCADFAVFFLCGFTVFVPFSLCAVLQFCYPPNCLSKKKNKEIASFVITFANAKNVQNGSVAVLVNTCFTGLCTVYKRSIKNLKHFVEEKARTEPPASVV